MSLSHELSIKFCDFCIKTCITYVIKKYKKNFLIQSPSSVAIVNEKFFTFFAHPENFLLTMVADERSYIRKLAFRKIIKIREQTTNKIFVRAFLPPKFNFGTFKYIELIDRSKLFFYFSPVMKRVINKIIQRYLRTK